MILNSKSTPPELNPSESSPLEKNPPKKQNFPSSHSDLQPSSPKKPKLNPPVQDSSSSTKPMTYEEHCEQLRKRFVDAARKSARLSRIEEPLPETPPKGYGWGCYYPGGPPAGFVCKMQCFSCGKARDHWTEDYKDRNTEQAKEWQKKFQSSFSNDEKIKPVNK